MGFPEVPSDGDRSPFDLESRSVIQKMKSHLQS
jgi:hypothetical protein